LAELVAIAIGGALGAVARFSLGNVINGLVGTQFPYGILLVNVLGSLLIGVFFELLVEDRLFPPVYRSVIIVGFLGAFTTFSTFSIRYGGNLYYSQRSSERSCGNPWNICHTTVNQLVRILVILRPV